MPVRRTARDEAPDEPSAEEDEVRQRSDAGDEGRPQRGGSRRPAPRRDEMTAPDAAEAALRQISQLTSKHPQGVVAVEPAEDGWIVEVEVVEERRVPSSADLLAIYETELDTDGSLLSYRRTKRYPRRASQNGEERS
jgi:hypothetical protein